MKKICQKECNGTPVEMLVDSELLITVRCMKQPGKKRDTEHDLDEFKELDEPYLIEEILNRENPFAPMSGYLQSFIAEVWEQAEELDPWYMEEELIEIN